MLETPYKIYSASAGSGKTFTLVKEYLKIILAPDSRNNFGQMLAITFTNKAVNEMKDRILGSLYNFSNTTDPATASPLFLAVVAELPIEPALLQQNSKRVLQEILHNYAFFDIATIDKFTHRIIRTFARDLKLPQNFEVVLDTPMLLEEAVGHLLSRAGQDNELTAVLIDFALQKIDEDKSWDISYDLQKIGRLIFDENHQLHIKKLNDKSISDFLQLRRTIRQRIGGLETQIIRSAEDILALMEQNALEFSDFKSAYFPNFIWKISQGDLQIDFKAAWKQHFGEEPLYTKKCQEAVKKVLDSLLPDFNQLFQLIKSDSYRLSFLQNSYNNLVPLTVLNAIQQEVRVLEKERDLLPIASFNTIVSEAIRDQPAPFIYERLGQKYRHYFIDEFQDTSELQWNNLVPLLSNALESLDEQGKMGSLTLVGDAKQAIYRWRGGRAEQFLNLMNIKGHPFVIEPSVHNLPVNYRSREEVVQFNNSFFTATSPFLYNTYYANLFVEGNQQQMNSSKGGLVHLDFLEEKGDALDAAYCSRILAIIREVRLKNYEYRDICILTRKRKHGILLSDYLLRQGIPIISSETLLLKASEKVMFLMGLLQFCTQPQDQENKYGILYYLAPDGTEKHRFIHDNMARLSKLLLEANAFDFGVMRRASVYDGLEYAIRQFHLADVSDAYLTYFMDEALQVEEKEDSSISTFLGYWDKNKDKLSIVAPENSNAVRVMTVHKSKGLEFPIVLFPYANTHIYEEIDPKLWLPVPQKEFDGFGELLVSKKQEVEYYGDIPARIYEAEQHKLELDAFNLLYVALTRAIQALYILTEKDLSTSGDPRPAYYSGLFIYYLKQSGLWEDGKTYFSFGELQSNQAPPSPGALEERINFNYSFKDRPGFKILTRAGMLWGTGREEAMARGNLVHQLMGWVGFAEDVEEALDRLHHSGAASSEDLPILRGAAERIMAHPELRKFFQKGLTIKNEWDIITQNGIILRPDRLVFNGEDVSILDYKTGRKNPFYHQQLEAYADALGSMGYTIANKIIVYIDDHIQPEFI